MGKRREMKGKGGEGEDRRGKEGRGGTLLYLVLANLPRANLK